MAGAAYDVSPATARAAASAANQESGTVINFGAGSWFTGFGTSQTATPSSSATAATKSPGLSTESSGATLGTNKSKTLWIIAGAAIALVLAVILILRKN